MSFDLSKIIHEMGPFALAIGAVLILMAIVAGSVVAERLWAFRKAARQSRALAVVATRLVERGELGLLVESAKEFPGSPLAGLLAAGVSSYQHAKAKPSQKLSAVELTRRELTRRMEQINADLRRGFGALASIGSVAPFVGLLGTVVGIITAFEGIAKEGSGGLGVVSAGIAEALVETALGLLVAIPTVMAFNWLSGKADNIGLALEQSKGELIDYLESQDPNLALPQQVPSAPAASHEARGPVMASAMNGRSNEAIHAA